MEAIDPRHKMSCQTIGVWAARDHTKFTKCCAAIAQISSSRSDEGADGQAEAKKLDYVPLPASVITQIEQHWSKQLGDARKMARSGEGRTHGGIANRSVSGIWVISGHSRRFARCPLFPRKQTL